MNSALYATHNLAFHLHASGEYERLHDLVCKPTWVHQHEELTGGFATFLEDLTLANQVVEDVGRAEVANGKSFSSLDRQIRYALMSATIISVSGRLTPQLVYQLVRHGVWSLTQGYEYTRLPLNPTDQLKLITLLSRLGLNDQDTLDTQMQALIEALTARVELPHGLSFKEILQNPLPPESITRIWKAVLTIYDEHDRLEAIAHLAPYLNSEQVDAAFAAIEQTILTNQLNVEAAIEALGALAPKLTREYIKKAVQWVQNLEAKAPLLVSSLAPYLDPHSFAELPEQIIALAPDWEAIVTSFATILPYAPTDELYQVSWESALLACEQIERGSLRIQGYVEIAEGSRLLERQWLVDELMKIFLENSPAIQSELLPYLASVSNQTMLELALKHLEEYVDKTTFSKMLIKIAPTLARFPSDYYADLAIDALRSDLTVRNFLTLLPLLVTREKKEQAREMLELYIGSNQQVSLGDLVTFIEIDDSFKHMALAKIKSYGWFSLAREFPAIATHLSQPDLLSLLDEAEQLSDFQDRVRALSAILPFIETGHDKARRALETLLLDSRQLNDSINLDRLVAGLLPWLQSQTRELLKPAWLKAPFFKDMKSFSTEWQSWIPFLDPDQLKALLSLVGDIKDEYQRGHILTELARYGDDWIRRQILEAVSTIQNQWVKLKVLLSCIQELRLSGKAYADSLINSFESIVSRFRIKIALAQTEQLPYGFDIFVRLIHDALSLEDNWDRIQVCSALMDSKEVPMRQELEQSMVQDMHILYAEQQEGKFIAGLTMVLPHVEQQIRDQLLDQAVDAMSRFYTERDDPYLVNTLQEIAPYPHSNQDAWLEKIYQELLLPMRRPRYRANALSSMVSYWRGDRGDLLMKWIKRILENADRRVSTTPSNSQIGSAIDYVTGKGPRPVGEVIPKLKYTSSIRRISMLESIEYIERIINLMGNDEAREIIEQLTEDTLASADLDHDLIQQLLSLWEYFKISEKFEYWCQLLNIIQKKPRGSCCTLVTATVLLWTSFSSKSEIDEIALGIADVFAWWP